MKHTGIKILSTAITLLMLFFVMIPTVAFAVSNAVLSCETVTASPGDTVDVRIRLNNNPGIVSATVKVNYDSNVMTLTKVTDAGVLGSQSHKPEYTSPYTLAWANDTATTNYTANGTIVTLTFKVGSNAESGKSYPIALSYDYNNYDIYDKDLKPVQFSITNGSISISKETALVSVEVSEKPTKVDYFIGEDLDTSGLQLKLTYDDGSVSYVTSGYTFNGFSSISAGEKTVTVAYEGKTTTFSVNVISTSSARLFGGSVTAKQGDTVDVGINMTNNPGIVSATIKVEYDSNILTLTKVTDAGVLGSQSHKPEYTSPYTLAWANDTATTNYTVNGTIATLTFKVASDAAIGKSYPITLSYDYNNYEIYDKDLNPIHFVVTNGSVIVQSAPVKLLGDVDEDGQVTLMDATLIQRYLSSLIIYGTFDDSVADTDGDEDIEVVDATWIQRYVSSIDIPYGVGEPI